MVEFARNSDDTSQSSEYRSTDTRTVLHRWPWSTCEPAGPRNYTHLLGEQTSTSVQPPFVRSRPGVGKHPG